MRRLIVLSLFMILWSVASSEFNHYDYDDYIYGNSHRVRNGRHGGSRHGASRSEYHIYANKVRWRVTSIANRVFAFKLYSRVASAHPQQNIIISPLVVSTGLSMILLGAEGVTENELMSVLEYSNIGTKRNLKIYTKADVPRLYESLLQKLNNSGSHQGDNFAIACRLFGEQSEHFLSQFIRDTQRYYGAEIEMVDFANNAEDARSSINSWVSDKTEGTILEALPFGAVDSSTLLALASAAYFKGTWKNSFDMTKTRPRSFTKSDGSVVTADFMAGKFIILNRYSNTLESHIIILPYKTHGNDFAIEMQLLLPRTDDALRKIENMTEMDLRRESRNMEKDLFQIYLPKFSIDFGVDLANTLVDLGLESLFGSADLSGMNGKRNLRFTSAMHKGFIKVDEKGTTASASFIGVTTRSATPPTIYFDRPFFFLIREKSSNSILFMGRVEDPQ